MHHKRYMYLLFTGLQEGPSNQCENFEPSNDFQQCGILTSIYSDEPVQPPLRLGTPNDAQSEA